MSETKTHTPGPWRVEASGPQSQGDWHFWDVVGPNGRIATVSAVAQRGPVDMDANEANARLIASAPAMAEALEGPAGTPKEISPLSWLRSMIDECKAAGPDKECEDPDAFWEMVSEVENLHRNATDALALARGETK